MVGLVVLFSFFIFTTLAHRSDLLAMNFEERVVSTADELIAASTAADVRQIAVRGTLVNVPSVRLTQGQALHEQSAQAEIRFATGVKGLQLTSDNQIRCIDLRNQPI